MFDRNGCLLAVDPSTGAPLGEPVEVMAFTDLVAADGDLLVLQIPGIERFSVGAGPAAS
jgi:hypothetical protein